jgi:hypothetical protein
MRRPRKALHSLAAAAIGCMARRPEPAAVSVTVRTAHSGSQ